jgi:hypothetical protein
MHCWPSSSATWHRKLQYAGCRSIGDRTRWSRQSDCQRELSESGANASEIIHIGQAIMTQPGEINSLMYFINTTFNYPTMAEAYRVAALNGYNRLS